jgi:hypothetical protein
MHPSDPDNDPPPLVIEPPAGSRLVAYGFLVLFGGGALVYSVGMGFVIDWPDDMPRWKLALIVGMPLVFAAVLASMAWENGRPFILDRARGVLLDRGRSVLSLHTVRAVAVRRDPDEICYYGVELLLVGGPTFCLRRDWWPMDDQEAAALARAEPIAAYLGVALHGPSGMVVHQARSRSVAV